MDVIGVTTIMGRPGTPKEELRYVIRHKYDVFISEDCDSVTGVICYNLVTAFEKYMAKPKRKSHLSTDLAHLPTDLHETD